ncbi:MAG TPA: hypothetical protein VLB50_09460 [Ignavibacteriaceae bacterium]|nr:hypothetical protein [Ignavibacteriaceae bacterium]
MTIKLDTVIYKPGTKELFNGVYTDSLNGMKIKFEVVNGKKNGKFETFYSNGNPQMLGYLKNNRNEGEWKYFYDDGSIESYGNFENDKPEGKWSWFFPDSLLRQTGYFHLGEREGIWKTYDETGTLVDSVLVQPDSTHPHKDLMSH